MEGERGAQAPNGWSGLHAMAMLHGFNRRSFEMLADTAKADIAAIDRNPVYRESELWRRVDDRACERAASCPVLLLNLNFECLEWWKLVCAGSADPLHNSTTTATLIKESDASYLLRDILMEIWKLGPSPPSDANLLFGLVPGVGAEIANLSGYDLDRIAVAYARELRPRWEENDLFWKKLLNAAIGADDEVLFSVHLHCLQLLGNDFELP